MTTSGIFISYRREDDAYAGRLADNLRGRFPPQLVFRDEEGLRGGFDFVESLDAAVRGSDVLLAVVGPHFLLQGVGLDGDDFVARELRVAREAGVVVLPVCVGGAAMPAPHHLPDDLTWFARTQAVHLDAGRRWSLDVDGLARELERLTQPGTGAGGWARRAMRKGRTALAGRRRLGVAAAGAALVAGVVSVAVMSSSETSVGPAGLAAPSAVAVGPDGTLYIADTDNHRVRSVAPDGVIGTVAGTGRCGDDGESARAAEAELCAPEAVALLSDGTLLIGDTGNGRLLRVTTDGVLEEVALAPPSEQGLGEEEPPRSAPDPGPRQPPGRVVVLGEDSWVAITALAVASDRLIAATEAHVLEIGLDGTTIVLAGTGALGFSGDGGPATEALLDDVRGVAVAEGAVYFADSANHRVRALSLEDGRITTVAGNGSTRYLGDGRIATETGLDTPTGLVIDASGNLLVSGGDGAVRRIVLEPGSPDAGRITTLFGGQELGFSGDGGPAERAQFEALGGLALGDDGGLYVVDHGNHRLRKVDPEGTVTTVA